MANILLIEDNPDHAALINHGLAEGGDQVVHQSDGISGLKYLESAGNHLPDLVCMDLKLPGMDGFEILKKIRANSRLKLLPVVMLTTSKYEKEIKQAYELGANGFVTKSEDFSELLAKLRRVKDYWFKAVERAS